MKINLINIKKILIIIAVAFLIELFILNFYSGVHFSISRIITIILIYFGTVGLFRLQKNFDYRI